MSKQKYFAAGDYVTREPANTSFQLLIETPLEKKGWKSRTSSPLGTTFPGSAIRFEEHYFEVLLIQNNGPLIHYYLNPWEERFPIRVQFPYTVQECIREMKAHQKEKKSQRLRTILLILAPVTGLLPAYEQILIQNEMGISSLRLTFISSVCTLFLGGVSFIFLVLSALAAGYGVAGPAFHIFYLGGSYLFFESLLRIYSALKLEEPMGSILLWLPVSIARQLFWPPKHTPVVTREAPNDEIRNVEGKNHDLEIISVLPKPHWNPRTGIEFEGVWYGMIDSQILQEGKETRYKFLLKKAPDNFSFRSTSVYTRDEINRLMRQRRRLELSTWVNTLAPLWGLLNKADQEKLEALYDFDALKFSLITIVSLTVLAFFNAIACVANLMSGRATRLDHLLVLPALYFLVEGATRLKAWRKGEPSGSILGVLARPFASRLLQ